MNDTHKFSMLTTLGGCASMLAVAAACAAPSAHAQGFEGSHTVVSGSPSIEAGLITLNDSQTVINWTPNDTSGTGVIDFLPSGRTVLFQNNSSSVSDYTVLNRILPVDGNSAPVSRVVAFNGTVQSMLGNNPGGSVWFYAPGGIIAGANSVFNVGSLVLTSNDIQTTGGLYDDSNGNAIRFLGTAGSLSAVQVMAGAQINALATGSYVALVAPRVVQGGTVTVTGSAAYVGAEAADIRINGGLFDISISAGTTDANGVVHSGTTTSPDPGPSGTGDIPRVFMMAVPKNNALTMLLSGNVGYRPATSVVQDGSAVVLSAGYDIAGGAIGARNAMASGEGSIRIGAGNWEPGVEGVATGQIEILSSISPATSFASNVKLTAERAITLRANQGGAITIGGDMTLTSGLGGLGGTIDLLTFGGSGSPVTNGRIGVAGALTLDASARGASGALIGESGTGGQINVIATGGRIIAAALNANADASGGIGQERSGDAIGGKITLSSLTAAGPFGAEGGAISFGATTLSASANVDSYFYNPSVDGGNATGGMIEIGAAGGSFTASTLHANVNARAGDATGVGGNATGGNVTLSASQSDGVRGNFALTDCGSGCLIDATASGGFGLEGGIGTGGSILIHATDADLSIPGSLYLNSDGGSSYLGAGGQGVGGSVRIESRAGNGVMTFGEVSAVANGDASVGGQGASPGSDDGSGTGGTVEFIVDGGSLTADGILAGASGRGGVAYPSSTPALAGNGRGGTVRFLITGGTADIGSLSLVAQGEGGEIYPSEGSGVGGAIAGQGIGGTVMLESRGGTLLANTINIDASGIGTSEYMSYQASGSNGGAGTGGIARLLMAAGGSGQVIVEGGVTVQASGIGGVGTGAGGTGTGGMAELTLASGSLTTPSVTVSAEGIGGAGGNNSNAAGGAAGHGVGGIARLAYLNEGHQIGALTVSASGAGGQAGSNGYISGYDGNGEPIYEYGTESGGAGGTGQGGRAEMLIDVDPAFASLIVNADGVGSAGGIGAQSGAGGTGTGGAAILKIAFGTTTVSDAVRVTASGVGGAGGIGMDDSGGRGGDAFGGSASLALTGSSTSLDAGNISVLAEAWGGAGGEGGLRQGPGVSGAGGGNASGGNALFAITTGASAITGAVLRVSGDATGGNGSIGTMGQTGGAGGSGGQAGAGSATLRIDNGRLRVDSSPSNTPLYSITAVGRGGAGAAGGDGTDAGLSGGPGGGGGAGMGGETTFEATDGDFALGDLAIVADGFGGLGALSGTGPGGASPAGSEGLSSGGTARFVNGGGQQAPGALRQLAALSMGANGSAGGRVLFTDSTTAVGGGLVAGAMSLSSIGLPVTGFSGITVAATSNPVQVSGDADLTTSGPLAFIFSGNGGLAGSGPLTGHSGTRIDVSHDGRLTGGYSLSAETIHLNTPGDINLTGDSMLRSEGMLTMLSQGGNINLSSGSVVTANSDLRLFVQGSINGAGSSLSAGGSAALGLGGTGDILLGNLTSGGLLDQTDASGNALGASGIAMGGSFVVSGRLEIGSGSGTLSAASIRIGTLVADTQTLTAAGGIQIGDADLSGLLQLRSPGAAGFARLTGIVNAGAIDIDAGSITSNALIARTGDMLLRSIGDFSIADVQAAGDILIASSAGGLTIGNADAGGSVTFSGMGITTQKLTSGGTATLVAGAGDLIMNDIAAQGSITASGRDISLGSSGGMTIANAVARRDLALNAGGHLTLVNRISGGTVTIGSSDIAIGEDARVSATNLLRFNAAAGQQPAVIGGSDVAGGYSLSAAELGRVTASNIAIAGAGDIIMRDLTIGTAMLPSDGTFSVSTQGRLRVDGALRMTGRTGQGGMNLSAGQAMEVIVGVGSIDLRNDNNALGGVLTLASPTIYVATLAAIADLTAASSLELREQRLAQNDGVFSDEGALRAGTIRTDVTDGLFIQNTGLSTAFADRRGFTANNFVTTTQGGAEIAVNGRLFLPTGAFATGLETIPLVAIDGGYAAGSKINGCVIAAAAGCAVVIGVDSHDTLEGAIDPLVTLARVFPKSLIQLREVAAEGYPPLIDEPVTGSGNEDMWESNCGGPGEVACGDDQMQ
ncbi:MAG: histidine kinase [Sphingomonadaceae bacterium]|nr:histidine kinase [Sphingomonadaceae bacterium]